MHCASYKTSKQAATEVENLAADGYPAFFTQVKINKKGIWYRVCSGKYETRDKAIRAAQEMVKKMVLSKYFILPISENQTIQSREKNYKVADTSIDDKVIVVGNKNSKRYHLPGMPFYNKVRKSHRILFKSESEAIKAGYHKSGENNINQVKVKQETVPKNEKRQDKNNWAQIIKDNKLRESLVKKDIAAEAKTREKISKVPSVLLSDKRAGSFKEPEQFYVEKEESNSGSPLYDKALNELKEKKYDKALITFKEFVARPDTANDLGERALRHMADCHFFLGEKGNKDHLSLAVQFYQNTLKSFPDDKRENAAVYFRLAKAYELLNNYYEAMKYYENLLSKYPRSVYVPEASFKIGFLLYKLEKYGPASDRLIAYLLKYRGGNFSKQAFYLVADCYYRMQQSANAEIWFRDAQKKWPNLWGIPKDVIYDMGQHKYALRSYGEAGKVFSFYANIYPNDKKIKEVLLLLAHSYKASEQISAALTIYNLIINKYPESKEAAESIMAMASLGIERPGYKVFFAAGNYNYYKNPLEAYNLLLTKNPAGEIAENALLQKGNALHKLKKDRAAVDTYLEFLKKHPQSKMLNEVRKSLKQASVALIGESFSKNDYLTVSDAYFKAYGTVPLQADDYETVDKIAISLRNVGLIDDSVRLLKNYNNVCRDGKIAAKVRSRIAETEIGRGKFNEAEKVLTESLAQNSPKNKKSLAMIKKNMAALTDQKRANDTALSKSAGADNNYWSMIQIAQDYSKKGNHAEAQKIFAKIKTESGPEGFWTKIVDYCEADREWWNKYGDLLKK
ncbi:MAG: tetratricopeptide repeat protein [Smithella sp.]